MKKTLILLTFLLGIGSCSTKQKENSDNIFYTINPLGTKLYENPSFESKVLKKVKVGEKLIAREILKTGLSRKIGKELALFGDFIKVKNENISGFIFSSDLTKFKPKIIDVYEGIMVADIFGIEKEKKTIKRIEKYNNKEYEIEDEITEYANGSYTYTAFDGCFNHVYIFKNMTFNEVYHQLTIHNYIINTTNQGNYLEIPEFSEKKGYEFHFIDEGATDDLKITDNKDGTFTISSSDCT